MIQKLSLPGISDKINHTLIIYGTIQIIQMFFYDHIMIRLESYMIQSMVNLEPKPSMVQSETMDGPVWNHK